MLQSIIEKLHEIYLADGYLDEKTIFSALSNTNIQLHEIEYICDQLLSMGVLFQVNSVISSEDFNYKGYDRCQLDYEEIYDEVISIDQNLSSFIHCVRQIQPPQHKEWHRLIPQAKNGNKYAIRRLVLMNLRAVIRIALAYHKKQGSTLSDTIQEGCIGLMMAIEKFEIDKQESFPQYFPWYVIRNIQLKLPFTPNPLFYYPANTKEKLNKIYGIVKNHVCDECECNYDCSELIREVTNSMNCSKKVTEKLLVYVREICSVEDVLIYKPALLSDNGYIIDTFIESLCKVSIQVDIEQLFDSLSDRETKVLKLRYGFENGVEYTLEKIGDYFGLTRERIRQIESKALKKLKKSRKAKYLRELWNEVR